MCDTVSMKKVEVVAALIREDNNIVVFQRSENFKEYLSLKWEFPGGKIEAGETNEEALKRELMEELNIDSKIGKLIMTNVHEYPDFELTMHLYEVESFTGEFKLNVHNDMKKGTKEELLNIDWAAADVPFLSKIK